MAEDKESIEKIIKKEYPYLKNHFSIKRIGLFGSFATNTAQKNSDVDLLVEFTAPIGFKFMALAEYLENKLGRKVDLLTPDGLKTIRIKQVAEKIKKSLIYV
jgi:predicted nucleotidyltransferase